MGDGVEITAPKLVDLAFSFEGEKLPEDLKVEYSLSMSRLGEFRLGVQFGITVSDIPGLTARAVYRMMVSLRPDSPEAADPEEAFEHITARLAPVAMYPFAREAFASIAQKALLRPLILPVHNVGALWKIGEIEIPPVSNHDTDGDDESLSE